MTDKIQKSKMKGLDNARPEIVCTHSDSETISVGESFAGNLKIGDVVALFGGMGSGKTTFVKGVSEGLGSADNVSSPTFTLINQYQGRLPIFHFDFYRIANSQEAWELGCEEYFGADGICLIEWAEHVLDLLPEKRIEVHFENKFDAGDLNRREITFLKK